MAKIKSDDVILPEGSKEHFFCFGESDYQKHRSYAASGVGAPFKWDWYQFILRRGGYSEIPPGEYCVNRETSLYQDVIVIEEGELSYCIDGVAGILHPGEIMFIPHTISRKYGTTNGIKYAWFHFHKDDSTLLPSEFLHRESNYHEAIFLATHLMLFDEFISSPQIHQTTELLIGYLQNDLLDSNRTIERKQKLTRFFLEIQNNLSHQWTIAEMAKANCLSESYFYDLVKKLFGCSPLEWVRTLRMKHASRLLACTNHNISTIACKCGYFDTAAFAKAFKRQYDVTPNEFRKSKESGNQ